MEARGPVRISDVEKAQGAIIRIARRLEQEGKIVVSGRGGEDVFV
jgi:flagellar motor switch protein FliG